MNTYTISKISKETGYYRVGVSKFLNSDKRFKKSMKNGLIVFKSDLNLDEINQILNEYKKQNNKNNIQKYNKLRNLNKV